MRLIETSLYKDLNVTIHHQWASLFSLHMNSKYQIPIYYNASCNNFNFDNEEIHCTLTYSVIPKFLDVPNIMNYENIMYFIAPSQNFHPFDLFKNKHLEKLNFPTFFYGQPRQFSKGFSYQQIS